VDSIVDCILKHDYPHYSSNPHAADSLWDDIHNHNEGRPTCGTARPAIVAGEENAVFSNAVDVGRPTQHSVTIGTDRSKRRCHRQR